MKACLFLACLIAVVTTLTRTQLPPEVQVADVNKLVVFNFCEFCNGMVSHACCKVHGKCCPVYDKCRENLLCDVKNDCGATACEFGCCILPDGKCCSITSAGIFFAPMLGVVNVSNKTKTSP